MVVDLSTAFAMRCPDCGRLDVHHINIFQLSGDRRLDFVCECGTRKAVLKRKGKKYISITYYCIICEKEHRVILPRGVFWARKHLNSLVCLDTDLNLGYFGSYKLIREELNRQQEELDSMADELGFDDFANPEIMLEILDYLHDIAAAGGLYCECGSHNINIELFSEKLELSCNNCNSVRQISASTKDDLTRIKSLDEIIIKFTAGKSKNF
ncbi:MAG: hypothetical protein ACOCRZ_00195 [Halothermotrichaceae bacterium]